MATQSIVIYCRTLPENSGEDSRPDQERDAREGAELLGVDTTSAIVICDEGGTGTDDGRKGYQRVLAMVRAGEIKILIVVELSRLSRGDSVMGIIRALIFTGARFISISDGIDTDQLGWEQEGKFTGIHDSAMIAGTQDEVGPGQRGRVLAEGSAGDPPYGYESYDCDADPLQQLPQGGVKPAKGLRIEGDQAHWVRQIFAWFIDPASGESIGEIARKLTELGVHKGRRSTAHGLHPRQVRRILGNGCYVGEWSWAATTTIWNSAGRKKQIPTQESVRRDYPSLRIVDRETWELAQAKLAQAKLARSKGEFGLKEGQ